MQLKYSRTLQIPFGLLNRARFVCLLDASRLFRDARGELPGDTPPSGETGRSSAPGDISRPRLLCEETKLLLLLWLLPLPVISSPSVIFDSPPQLATSSSAVTFTMGGKDNEGPRITLPLCTAYDFSLADLRIISPSAVGMSL